MGRTAQNFQTWENALGDKSTFHMEWTNQGRLIIQWGERAEVRQGKRVSKHKEILHGQKFWAASTSEMMKQS
jgi:hypothetical protein